MTADLDITTTLGTADSAPISALSAPFCGWAAVFLEHLSETGNVAQAARIAGVNRDTPYKRREVDQDFAAAMDTAVETAVDALELEARRRAMGWTETVTQGDQVRAVHRHSDVLMVTLLKAHRPSKFRENVQHEHGGKIEVRVTYVKKPLPGTTEA